VTFTVGTSSVANFANTYPGTALGVVANANNGYGDSVGNGEVIIGGNGVPTAYFILMENSGYVLQENSSKIQLEA
jgi:hypothetical protein